METNVLLLHWKHEHEAKFSGQNAETKITFGKMVLSEHLLADGLNECRFLKVKGGSLPPSSSVHC